MLRLLYIDLKQQNFRWNYMSRLSNNNNTTYAEDRDGVELVTSDKVIIIRENILEMVPLEKKHKSY